MRLSYEGSDYVSHSTPISKVIFETNWRLFRTVFDDMSDGSMISSMSLAKTILLDVAKNLKKDDAAQEFLNAINSRTFVSLGGKTQLLADANIDDDVKGEIESNLIFFTVFSHHLSPTKRAEMMEPIASILRLEFTSSNAMEYFSSLTISTTEDNIIETIQIPLEDQSFPI